jgi:hypothetical protein
MAMQFFRVISPVEDMEIWNASGNGFSFVISYESRSGPGFHGRTGFVASWRPIHQNRCAISIGGSPFKTLAEAEEACKVMLGNLTREPGNDRLFAELVIAAALEAKPSRAAFACAVLIRTLGKAD